MKTMKKYIHSIVWLACMAVVLSACTKTEGIDNLSGEAGGNLQLNFTIDEKMVSGTKADTYDPLATSTLRIYQVESDGAEGTTERLIRKYKPANDVPASLYLVSGTYKVTVEAGDGSEATFTNKTYYGEETFELAAHETKTVNVDCKIKNVAVKVVFDPTIQSKFDISRIAYVSASDVFSKADAENNLVPTLTYDTDTTGYFLLPEGVSNLSWGFYGESSDADINKNNSKTGTIQLPQGGYLYTLTFKYSKTPDGYLTVTVNVREWETVHDDNYLFSPDPSISGEGFNIKSITGYYTDPISFAITSINPLASLKFTDSKNTEYAVLDGGNVIDGIAAQGISYTKTDEYNGKLTLDGTFFGTLESGINPLNFVITDTDGGEGKATAQLAIAGASGISSPDLWFGTGNLDAIVTNPSVTDVQIKYRSKGKYDEVWSEWSSKPAVKGADGFTYSVSPSDLAADHTYEFQLTENGTEVGAVKTVATETGIQLPNAGFEDWNKNGAAWYPYSAGGTAFWGSGNPGSSSLGEKFNTTTGISDPRPGSSGSTAAQLQTQKPSIMGIGRLAAGNIFVGEFGEVSGTGGYVKMGRAFTFNAKPKALRVWYKYNLGEGDKGRIFACLVNMTNGSTYHTVNTNKPEATTFDPKDEFLYTDKTNTGTLEGHIIGYGDFLIEASQNEWKEYIIPITYREQYSGEKPNVLLVTATASYRGDYFEGSTDSKLVIDDFEFIY